jgi:hypothetical protein
VAFVALWYTILLGQRIKIIYTMLLQDQMMWLSISCIKIIQLHRKLEKVAANDGESNDFTIKMLEIILTNNIHSYKVVMAEWSMLCVH